MDPRYEDGRAKARTPATPEPPPSVLPGSRLPALEQDERSRELVERIRAVGHPAAREAISALEGAHPTLARHVLRLVAAYPSHEDVLSTIGCALRDGSYRAIPNPKIQAHCLDVLVALPEGTRPAFSRAVAGLSSGRSTALLDRDSTGRPLVSNLRSIAAHEIMPAIREAGLSRPNLLAQVAQEALWPTRTVNQGLYKGTCAPACLHYMICCENPAEYTRLMHGLLTGGKVDLANGDKLELARGSLKRDETFPSRSDSERIFHAALMEYANGDRHRYCNQRDIHLPLRKGDRVFEAGLRPDMIVRAARGLFAEPFDMWTARSELELGERRGWLKTVLGIGNASLRRSVETSQIPEVVQWLKGHRGDHLLIALAWSAGDDLHGRHAVVYEGFREGRYHFRNPWGSVDIPDGTRLSNPSRRVEDGRAGRESMAADEFEKRICVVCAPARMELAKHLSAAREKRRIPN